MPSDRLLTNAFPVTFEGETCPYQTWAVVGLDDEDENFDQNRITLRRLISRDVGGPAEIAHAPDGRLTVYVPEGCGTPQEAYELVPRVAKLRESEPGILRVHDNDPRSRRLAERFLQSAVDQPLHQDPSLWQPRAGRAFFEKTPANHHDPNRYVDVFEGHNVRVAHVEGVGFVVFIRETVRYVRADPWPTRIAPNTRKDFLKGERRTGGSATCVYRFGQQWYEVTVQSILPDTVSDVQFVDVVSGERVTVYEYTKRQWAGRMPEWTSGLDPQGTAINYRTWKGSERRTGFAQLCHRVLTTEEVRAAGGGRLHSDHAIRSPDVRLKGATAFARTLAPFSIGGLSGSVGGDPAVIPTRSFPIPSLEYGGGRILSPPARLREYPRERMEMLRKKGAGLWDTSPLGQQWALVPKSIKEGLWSPFLTSLQAEIRSISDGAYEYDPTIIWYDAPGAGLARQVRAVHAALERRGSAPAGYCLAVLPERAHDHLAATLTSDLAAAPPLHVACIHQASFGRFFEKPKRNQDGPWRPRQDSRTQSRARGYVRNVALKVLLLNNKWPFVLADDEGAHNDSLYVGLDVLNGTAGFTFMARGGRLCFFKSSDSVRREKLSPRLVYGVLSTAFDHVKDILGSLPERVVLLRDGRLYPGEQKGFEAACTDAGVGRASAIEVRKRTAAGHRLFAVQGSGDRQQIRNPRVGSWLQISADEAVIATTGFPFNIPGTAQPVLIRQTTGPDTIERLAHDVFLLTQLAWTAPDRSIRDPFVLRYTDQRLRAVGTEAHPEEVEYAPVGDA